jgi:predicted AAA+ superfamily ATPase
VILAAGAERDAYHYRTRAGTEMDLLIVRGGCRYGFEFKFEDAPGLTRSMHNAVADLELKNLWVVTPGERRESLSDRISILPLGQLNAEIGKI